MIEIRSARSSVTKQHSGSGVGAWRGGRQPAFDLGEHVAPVPPIRRRLIETNSAVVGAPEGAAQVVLVDAYQFVGGPDDGGFSGRPRLAPSVQEGRNHGNTFSTRRVPTGVGRRISPSGRRRSNQSIASPWGKRTICRSCYGAMSGPGSVVSMAKAPSLIRPAIQKLALPSRLKRHLVLRFWPGSGSVNSKKPSARMTQR